MPVYPLIAAVRAADSDEVSRLLRGGAVDASATCEVESSSGLPHESPLYTTTALFEAVRVRDRGILKQLLQHAGADLNQAAGATRSTPLADCCARGDVEMASALLDDSRTNAALGDVIVPHPAVYAALTGNNGILELFAARQLLTDDLESLLLSTAQTCGHAHTVELIRKLYVEMRPLDHPAMRAAARAVKVRGVCARFCSAHDQMIDVKDLQTIATALGTPLTSDELMEARMALNPSGDGRMHADAIVAWWLGDDALDAADAVDGDAAAAAAASSGIAVDKQHGGISDAADNAIAGGAAATSARVSDRDDDDDGDRHVSDES